MMFLSIYYNSTHQEINIQDILTLQTIVLNLEIRFGLATAVRNHCLLVIRYKSFDLNEGPSDSYLT